MSSYLTDQVKIDAIVVTLANRPEYEWLLRDRGYNLKTREGQAQLSKALHSMNVEALVQRYGDDPKTMLYAGYRPSLHNILSKMQFYKVAKELLYQCAEGNVPESDLYKFLDRLISWTAGRIVENLPEFERALYLA